MSHCRSFHLKWLNEIAQIFESLGNSAAVAILDAIFVELAQTHLKYAVSNDKLHGEMNQIEPQSHNPPPNVRDKCLDDLSVVRVIPFVLSLTKKIIIDLDKSSACAPPRPYV